MIRQQKDQKEEEANLSVKYVDELHRTVDAFDTNRFVVKKELRHITEYKVKKRWENISKSDVQEIDTHLAPLVIPHKDDDELARRFDILILKYQLALLVSSEATDTFVDKIYGISKELLKKQNIPAVAIHVGLLKKMQTDLFWQAVNINRLEEIRTALRGLIKFIDKESQIDVITHFEDEIDTDGIETVDVVPVYKTLQSYKDRVESYVRKNKHHTVIQKLNTNLPITEKEIGTLETILFDNKGLGSKQDYLNTYGDKPLGEFIRSIVGLDIKAAHGVFAEFLQAGNLIADQITFVNNIITHLTKNGTIDKAMLFQQPFTDINDQGLLGVFDDAQATKIINIVDRVNDNARVAVG